MSTTKKIRNLLETSNVPEKLIQEIEVKPLEYQTEFIKAIEKIMENEVINLLAFMEIREKITEKARA